MVTRTHHIVTFYVHSLSLAVAKGKGHPIRGNEGPEGEQRYSSTLSLTLTLDGFQWLPPRPDHFTPGTDLVPIIYKRLGWEPVWTGAENLALTGIRSPDRTAEVRAMA